MTTVSEQQATSIREAVPTHSPEPWCFTVAEYYRMSEAGILRLDERLELLDGQIVKMNLKSTEHLACNISVDKCFRKHLGEHVIIRNQKPAHLSNTSELEPDLVLAVPQGREYADHHPTPDEILLVLEIADSSVQHDRELKGLMYAAAGIKQYLLLNLRARELEDYREPDGEGYRSKQTYRADESFSLVAFPEVRIKVSELLPPE